jgi:hypothetical protein
MTLSITWVVIWHCHLGCQVYCNLMLSSVYHLGCPLGYRLVQNLRCCHMLLVLALSSCVSSRLSFRFPSVSSIVVIRVQFVCHLGFHLLEVLVVFWVFICCCHVGCHLCVLNNCKQQKTILQLCLQYLYSSGSNWIRPNDADPSRFESGLVTKGRVQYLSSTVRLSNTNKKLSRFCCKLLKYALKCLFMNKNKLCVPYVFVKIVLR